VAELLAVRLLVVAVLAAAVLAAAVFAAVLAAVAVDIIITTATIMAGGRTWPSVPVSSVRASWPRRSLTLCALPLNRSSWKARL
jgi:hypothetical protein